MSTITYKGKTITDCGKTEALRKALDAEFRWGVYMVRATFSGNRYVREYFPTLALAKAAIDHNPDAAL